MNLSDETNGSAPNWSIHVEQAKKFNGSFTAYCREQNIDYDQFMYYLSKSRQKSKKMPVKESNAVFTKIKVEPTGQNIRQQLPDPEWVAKLIHHLMRKQ
jgi:hypothetical protein